MDRESHIAELILNCILLITWFARCLACRNWKDNWNCKNDALSGLQNIGKTWEVEVFETIFSFLLIVTAQEPLYLNQGRFTVTCRKQPSWLTSILGYLARSAFLAWKQTFYTIIQGKLRIGPLTGSSSSHYNYTAFLRNLFPTTATVQNYILFAFRSRRITVSTDRFRI